MEENLSITILQNADQYHLQNQEAATSVIYAYLACNNDSNENFLESLKIAIRKIYQLLPII